MKVKSRSHLGGIEMSDYEMDVRCDTWSPKLIKEQRRQTSLTKEKVVVKSLLR